MISFRINSANSVSQKMKQRQSQLYELGVKDSQQLFSTYFDIERVGQTNCENLVGSVELPVGVAGPVIIKSQELTGEMVLPLATTEGALVASISRGCKAIQQAGGAEVIQRKVGMSRAPVFKCQSQQQALKFEQWIKDHWLDIKKISEATSNHLILLTHQSWVRGRYVYVRFVFDTDQAMGMNMVTIALQAVWKQLLSKVGGVKLLALSSNVCTDKKESAVNRLLGRGYWVQACVKLSAQVLAQVLKTDAPTLLEVHLAKNLVGSNVAGSHSQNMQAANVVAAMFAATGQDLAHVVEGSQSSTLVEPTDGGVLATVTLPNLNVGVVGGGTWLAAQSQARNLIIPHKTKSKKNLQTVTAPQLVNAIAVGVLAGEISGLAALASHSLAKAHHQLGRSKKSHLKSNHEI